MGNLISYLDIGGLFLLLSVFWGGALINLLNWETAKKYIEEYGFIANSSFILSIAIVWQFMGGVFLLIPMTATYGAILLILFTIVSSVIFRPFWNKAGVEKYENIIHFLSNLGVIGGLCLLLNRI